MATKASANQQQFVEGHTALVTCGGVGAKGAIAKCLVWVYSVAVRASWDACLRGNAQVHMLGIKGLAGFGKAAVAAILHVVGCQFDM